MKSPYPELKKTVIDNILTNAPDAIYRVMTDTKRNSTERHALFNEVARIYWGTVKEQDKQFIT